jgi:hypothetical protein
MTQLKLSNVIDDYGNEIELTEESYLYEAFEYLKTNLEDFNDYLFIFWGNNSDSLPLTRHLPHPKKILIWGSNENKNHNIEELKDKYYHIFTNYHKTEDENNITSLPLGFHTWIGNWKPIPMEERLFNISFSGCLNRNRIPLASEITGIPTLIIGFGLRTLKKLTLSILNTIALVKHNNHYFKFNPDFNKGLSPKDYHFFLKNTKVALIPKGWVNSETFRLYESMKWGCVLITEELPHREYYKDIPVIQVQDWKVGWRIANELILDGSKLDHLSKQTQQYYEDYLSSKAVGRLFERTLKIKKK